MFCILFVKCSFLALKQILQVLSSPLNEQAINISELHVNRGENLLINHYYLSNITLGGVSEGGSGSR